MTHTITTTEQTEYPQMRNLDCDCGYHAEAHERWAQKMVEQHYTHPAAHLDPRNRI